MWFRKRSLQEILDKTHRIKVHGVIFYVRKINPMDYLTGSKAVLMNFDTYKTAGQKEALASTDRNIRKLQEHYRDVFMASVIEPKLSRKKEDGAIFVDNLFTDWDLATQLYLKIMEITHGKKKFRSLNSLRNAPQTSTQ